MNQQLEANRSYVDNLLAQIKEQGAEIITLREQLAEKDMEIIRLRELKTEDSPLLYCLDQSEELVVTLREQRDKLATALKELADLAEIRTTPHEHVPGIGNAVARARAIIREVEGEK